MIFLRRFTFLVAMLLSWRAFAAALPLVEDFELTSGSFTTSSATSWKWGPPVAGPHAAHSGTQAWGTNLTSASYSSSEDAILTSPAYDLSAFAGKAIVVHWWQWLESEDGYDPARVEVSRDGGGTWETVFGPRSGVVDASWTQHTAMLDPSYATAAFKIRFRLISDDYPSDGGFFIDDLRLTAATLAEAVPRQDFELGDGGYVASGANSSWAYGTPVSAPGAAFSGSHAWATNLNGLYNASEASALTSSAYDLTGSAGKLLVVSWRQFFDTEEGYDFGAVEVSNDNGATWSAVQSDEALTGVVSAPGWMRRQAFVDATFATGAFRLRFRFTADETYQFDGWAIDDVAIFATSGLAASAGSFSKATPPNTPIKFTKTDFAGRFTDPDGGALTGIVITQLPANGTLKLGAAAVTAGQTIALADLPMLTYEPLTDAVGTETFLWSASNFFGPSARATVTLNVLAPTPLVVITADPEPQTVNPGTLVTFRVTAVSSLTLNYQWRRNSQPITGANAATYTISAAAETDEDSYDVIVNNTGDTGTSAAAALSVNDPVTFTQQLGPTFVNEGDSITLTVGATGTGRLDFQWTKDNAPIQDATFSSLQIVDAKLSDQATYRCVVTNIVGPKTSDPAAVSVHLKPRFVVHPVSRGIVENGRVVFSVQVEGFGPFTYQWIKDGTDIPGATEPTLTLEHLLNTDAGNYTVRIGNGVAEKESDPARLQVFTWGDVKGTYQDVLEQQEPSGADQTPFPGRLTVTIARGGRFTGKLNYRGLIHVFRGSLDTELAAAKTISRRHETPLTVRVQLDPSTLTVSASVTHDTGGVAFRSEGLLPLHVYSRLPHPAPQRGRYTVLLQPGTAPVAPGYLIMRISARGRVTIAGKLPDGSVVSTGSYVQSTSRIAFYRRLYPAKASRAGELCGRITLPATDVDAEVGGELSWRKPTQKVPGTLPGPFVAEIDVVGSRYKAPSAGHTVVELPQDQDLLDLRIAGLVPGELQRWIHLTPTNAFFPAPVSGEKIGLSIARRTGRVTGAYTDTVAKERHSLEGVVLQAQGMFGGMLKRKAPPGSFTMVPLVQ